MPAPRLLDKRVLNAEIATARKQDAAQGLALAKKVDVLRETVQEEEARLAQFRSETIAAVQKEIDAKIAEKDSLERGNVRLREERIQAQAPIDLKEEWQKVREDRSEVEAWKDSLTQQSISLLAREEDNRLLTEALSKEREQIRKEHELSQQNLRSAEEELREADDVLSRARTEATRVLAEAKQREAHLSVREEDATLREMSLSQREAEVDAHEINLAEREEKLRVNQEIFVKAQAYINNRNE